MHLQVFGAHERGWKYALRCWDSIRLILTAWLISSPFVQSCCLYLLKFLRLMQFSWTWIVEVLEWLSNAVWLLFSAIFCISWSLRLQILLWQDHSVLWGSFLRHHDSYGLITIFCDLQTILAICFVLHGEIHSAVIFGELGVRHAQGCFRSCSQASMILRCIWTKFRHLGGMCP